MSENRKQIEIVNGDGSNLDISRVYDHLSESGKPKCKDKNRKNIIIPKNSKTNKKKNI